MKGAVRWLLALFVLAAGALGAWGWNAYANSHVRLTEYEFSHRDVPGQFDGYKLLLVSDLHEAPFGEQILEIIRRESPDVVLFCGDLVQLPGYGFEQAKAIAQGVGDSVPMYAVSGNHESQNREYEHIVGCLWDEGIHWLENDSVWLEKNGQRIYLIGLKDCGQHDPGGEGALEEIRWTVGEHHPGDDSLFILLLNHRANLYPYLKDTGVDLILSGHMHGGLLRLPFVRGVFGREGGETALFPQYTYGFYDEGEAAMIVSGGCDKNPEKVRVFNQPEVVLVTLKREGASGSCTPST